MAAIPRGWLVAGVACLAPSIVAGNSVSMRLASLLSYTNVPGRIKENRFKVDKTSEKENSKIYNRYFSTIFRPK